MNKLVAMFLLSLFTLSILVSVYSACSKGTSIALAMVEEDESHLETLEVKKFIRNEQTAFNVFEMLEFASEHLVEYQLKVYEDVLLSSIETPPDFKC